MFFLSVDLRILLSDDLLLQLLARPLLALTSQRSLYPPLDIIRFLILWSDGRVFEAL
jgi:hypothetical protein